MLVRNLKERGGPENYAPIGNNKSMSEKKGHASVCGDGRSRVPKVAKNSFQYFPRRRF